jgi:hypothetical protein
MKRIICLLITMVFLGGCAHMYYKAQDGTTVSYTRLFTTADQTKATVGAATVEINGQKIDAASMAAFFNVLNALGGTAAKAAVPVP